MTVLYAHQSVLLASLVEQIGELLLRNTISSSLRSSSMVLCWTITPFSGLQGGQAPHFGPTRGLLSSLYDRLHPLRGFRCLVSMLRSNMGGIPPPAFGSPLHIVRQTPGPSAPPLAQYRPFGPAGLRPGGQQVGHLVSVVRDHYGQMTSQARTIWP